MLGAHETLIAATRTNAELLGIAAETGTLEPGKRADLLIVDGDPLADIAVLQHPDNLTAIVKAGQFHKRQIYFGADEGRANRIGSAPRLSSIRPGMRQVTRWSVGHQSSFTAVSAHAAKRPRLCGRTGRPGHISDGSRSRVPP